MFSALLIATLFVVEPPKNPTTPPAPTPVAPAADAIPAATFLKDKPKDAKPVREAKSKAKAGEKITIVGRVGGRADPFVKGRAMFLIADPSLKACNELPGDKCTKPWDFCCESPETMKACLATVQIVNKDGKLLKVSAEGAGGLKPLSKVTVVGVVREVSNDGAFIVDAEGIFVE